MIETLSLPDGRTLAYERRGSGTTLVCHPGGPGFSGAGYFGSFAGLDADVEVIVLDPRGTGGSAKPADPTAYTVADFVADLESLRAHLGLERMNLLGHSHGGVVAQVYAATHPERIAKLILANTLCRFHDEQQAAMELAMKRYDAAEWYADATAALEQEQAGSFTTDDEMRELLVRELPFYFAELTPAAGAWIEAVARDDINADSLRFFNEVEFTTFDTRPLLTRITAPTLIIHSVEDFITGDACSRDLIEGLPHATEVLLPPAGHFSWIEQPTAFRDAVVEFLAHP